MSLVVCLQPAKMNAQAMPTSWLGRSTRGLHPSGWWSCAQVGSLYVIPTASIHYKLRCLLTWV